MAPGQLELGKGIHGEAGAASLPLCSAREAVARLLDHMTKQSASKLELKQGDQLAVLISNLGGSSKAIVNLGLVKRDVSVL